MMNLLIYFFIAALVVFLDLFTKFLVKSSEVLMSGGVIDLIPGIFRFRYVENPGAAMGSFVGNRWVFMLFSTVAIIGIVVYLVINRKTVTRLAGTSLALIMGGGIGNMYERLFNKNAQGVYVVTDFLDFYPLDFWKWVFNVADAAVCVGAGLMVLYLILDIVREVKEKKHPELYDELVALDGIEEDDESLADLMALDGAEAEPESPLMSAEENGQPEADEDDVDDGYEDIDYDGEEDGLDVEDSFPIYDADDVDDGDEENDFFVEDDEEEDDLL